MSFPSKLTEIMQKRNITAQDIAKQSYGNISVSNIRSFQKGTALPKPNQIRLLNHIFGVDFELILNPSPQRIKPTSQLGIQITEFGKVSKIEKPGEPKKKKDNIPIIPVNGQCTFHGCNESATENCHYTGWEQTTFGKGMSEKCSNLFVADLCHEHHIYFDQPKERKSERMSSEFKTCILLSIKRKLDRGNIVFKK